ncbi:MAG: hemerythrin domain-containing protein [Planctomycetaceae bacterium]|nr:hemerythrin domain-containing protein [Planctomycetaceae bacterium]MCA9021012.1 hemerythrin domain-containing protein [Planctomycetaceae bacterium]
MKHRNQMPHPVESVKITHEHLQYLLDEHEEILSHIKDLNQWWTELDEHGLPKYGEMGTRMEGLRDLLSKHFSDEEQEGYFKPLMDEEPGFCIMVPDFKERHKEFLNRLDDFSVRLKQSKPPFQSWNEALQEFKSLLGDLRTNEKREIERVQEAYEKSSHTQ